MAMSAPIILINNNNMTVHLIPGIHVCVANLKKLRLRLHLHERSTAGVHLKVLSDFIIHSSFDL